MPSAAAPLMLWNAATARLRAIGGAIVGKSQTLSGVDDSRCWWPLLSGHFGAGDWQADVEIVHGDRVMAQAAVYACATLIAGDIGKMRIKLVEQVEGIWTETASPAFSPVLRKPNRYQTRQKFIESWVLSKLGPRGNAYILKERDARGVVVRLYVLDPNRVQPLVADDGSVYYQVQRDNLAQVPDEIEAIPASEIIHDRGPCLFHPLVGVSPIFACGLSATQALKIGANSTKFFENMSRPSGILTAPGRIDDITAKRLGASWEANYGGGNLGRVAVLGDGLAYQAMTINPVDAQLVEQLKLSAEQVCSVYHVPAYMVGAAPAPAYNNVESLNQQYYSQCLQVHIEAIEALLDDGLGLDATGRALGTEFDLDGLLRMDSATLVDSLSKAVGAAIMTPNESRGRLNLPPVPGGDTPYMQQQNWSLAQLDRRDIVADKPAASPPPAAAEVPPAAAEDQAAKQMQRALETMKRGFADVVV